MRHKRKKSVASPILEKKRKRKTSKGFNGTCQGHGPKDVRRDSEEKGTKTLQPTRTAGKRKWVLVEKFWFSKSG